MRCGSREDKAHVAVGASEARWRNPESHILSPSTARVGAQCCCLQLGWEHANVNGHAILIQQVRPLHLQMSASMADSSSSNSLCSCWTEAGSRRFVMILLSWGRDSGGQISWSCRASCLTAELAAVWAADLAASCRDLSPLPGCQYAGVASTCCGYSLLMHQNGKVRLGAGLCHHCASCVSLSLASSM